MSITLRPILTWPGTFTEKRRNAQFKVDYSRALRDLAYELRQLKAQNVVLQLAITERDIRRDDGWLRADARLQHPGVILTFENKLGTFSYPCDTFSSWQDNIRAIGLALESLRAVDRYGVSGRGEQYTGWKALPNAATRIFTPQQAAALVAHLSGVDERIIMASPDNFESARRSATKKLHPDANGGKEHPQWHRLMEAIETLKIHHNL